MEGSKPTQANSASVSMFDVAHDLRERFDWAAYFYMSAWEHDPNMRIEGNTIIREENKVEEMLIDTFEALRDTVDAVPDDLVKSVGALREQIGAERYEQIVGDHIEAISPQFLPGNATEFVATLSRMLQGAA